MGNIATNKVADASLFRSQKSEARLVGIGERADSIYPQDKKKTIYSKKIHPWMEWIKMSLNILFAHQ
jgi:hypothetical protein